MVKDSVFTFFTQIIVAVTGLVTTIMMSRILQASGMGVYSFVQTVISVSVLVGTLGIGFSNTYFLGSKKYSLTVLFWNSLFLGALLSVFSILGIIVFNIIHPSLFRNIDHVFILIAIASVPFYLISTFLQSLLLGAHKIFFYNAVFIANRVFDLVAILIFLFIFPSVITALIILGLSGVINLISSFYFLWKINPLLKPQFDIAAMADTMSFGLKGQLGSMAQVIDINIAIFLLNFFLTPAAVGIYSIALFLGLALKFVPDSLGTVLFPRVSMETREGVSEVIANKSCRISLFLTLLFGILLAIFSPLAMEVFGRDFTGGYTVLRILIIGMVFSSIPKVLGNYIIGKGYPMYYALISFISLFFNFLVGITLIPRFGINGAAMAATVSYIFASITFILVFRKIAGQHFNLVKLLIPQREDFARVKVLVSSLRRVKVSQIKKYIKF
jgi:O-antigen/teichoic acid export membrane protein